MTLCPSSWGLLNTQPMTALCYHMCSECYVISEIIRLSEIVVTMKKILFVCERNVVMGPAAAAIFCHMGVSLLSR